MDFHVDTNVSEEHTYCLRFSPEDGAYFWQLGPFLLEFNSACQL
jgi:hypothetical protein